MVWFSMESSSEEQSLSVSAHLVIAKGLLVSAVLDQAQCSQAQPVQQQRHLSHFSSTV